MVNGLAFGLVASLVKGFIVSGPLTAILAALLTSVASTLLGAALIDD